MQSVQAKVITNWCYGCVDRVGGRRFRELTRNGVCEDCARQGRQAEPQDMIIQKTIKVLPTPRSQRPAQLKRKTEAQQRQELLEAERLKRKIEIQEKKDRLSSELLKEENQLIQTFNQLQAEAVGREWRHLAAQRLNWDFLKLRRVAWRVKRYNSLEPTLVKDQVLKIVTEEDQTLKQISKNFQKFSRQWIYEILERLAREGYIEKKPIQKTVGKKKTYEMLYRLLQTD